MNSSLVSVLIPAYNCALFVEQTVQSVLNQSYANFEILICDDESTDNTLAIIRNLAKHG